MILLRSVLPALFLALAVLPAAAADPAVCFSASQTYRVHPLRGAADLRDGWAVHGSGFDECVHRAITAQRLFLEDYPQDRFSLVLAATIGCHAPC